jgi:hypothetical protein
VNDRSSRSVVDWQPLSVREGLTPDGPYEGVSLHLLGPLRQWVQDAFGGLPGSFADSEGGPRLAAAIRYPVYAVAAQRLTVQQVVASIVRQPGVLLDVVDAVLRLKELSLESRAQLDELFAY